MRIVVHQLGFSCTLGKLVQDQLNRDPRPANHRLAHHYRRIDFDALGRHRRPSHSDDSHSRLAPPTHRGHAVDSTTIVVYPDLVFDASPTSPIPSIELLQRETRHPRWQLPAEFFSPSKLLSSKIKM